MFTPTLSVHVVIQCYADTFSGTSVYSGSEKEHWSDTDEDCVLNEIAELRESEPEDNELPVSGGSQRPAVLARWLALILLYMQTTFHISEVAIACFFKFLKAFLAVLGRACSMCAEIAKCFPSSSYVARKAFIQAVRFRRYVVCRKCHHLYFLKDCVEGAGMSQRSKLCSYQKFPTHRQVRMRAACGCILIKTVELASGRHISYPFLTYCYMSVTTSLQSLLNRPEFFPMCEQWRTRSVEPGVYRDVYDGNIWKEFLYYDDQPFLSEPHNYALMLNMDFFQPYKHVNYSVGALYCTILNLPRSVRYKQENVLLVGLLPGPHEPEHNINSYLEPFVGELLQFWDGVDLYVPSITGKQRVRLALICVSCDIPAGRKVCGFLGHSAHYGCSRCWKKFSGGVGTMDYSGFNRDGWQLRTGFNHRQVAERLQHFSTRAEQERTESTSGCRYSVLLKLPYFDAPQMLIIDPMHNLFLGTAKHYLKSIWLHNDVISEVQFESIQRRVDSSQIPAELGRIPHKIRSGFSSFTADQWKNWTCYFSLISLFDIIKGDDLERWRHFVLACRLLTTMEITKDQIQLGDALLVQFCRRTERLYGKECITPNMHYHCHLRSCIHDYGPLHGFWLYAFERYNGILGRTPNNNRSIEGQSMKRYVTDSLMLGIQLPSEYSEELGQHFK